MAAPPIWVFLAAAVLWFLALAGARLATADRRVRPGPPVADPPGDEPPAVVALVTGSWEVRGAAAEATLVDLAARGLLHLRPAVGSDPAQVSVVRPRSETPAVTDLTRYEKHLLNRVEQVAGNGTAPLAALAMAGGESAGAWWRTFRHGVVTDARHRGLSRPRARGGTATVLIVTAIVPALALGWALAEPTTGTRASGLTVAGPILLWFAAVFAVRAALRGERDTPAGRDVAAGWLGWQPSSFPSARDDAYRLALGRERSTLDLGKADRNRLWSSYGGRWRQVRVHYPRTGPGGRGVGAVVGWLAWRVYVGAAALFAAQLVSDRWAAVGTVLAVVGAVLLLSVVYALVRAFGDLAAERTVTGQVLWTQLWRTKRRGINEGSHVVHHLAIDDGRSDRTTAWAIPSEWAGRFRPGSVITVTVRPWSRRVTSLIDAGATTPTDQGPPVPA